MITCGASEYLRQEFYELELLDEITKLRYEGKLPDHIQGKFRNPLIRAYQKWKSTEYVHPLTYPALQWSVKEPLPLLPAVTDASWQIIDKKKKKDAKSEPATEVETETAAKAETTNIHPGFVAAVLSILEKSKNLKKLIIQIQLLKEKRKPRLKYPLLILLHLLDLYGMALIIVVCMMLCLQYCMTSCQLM
jgi:hypothetical protein